MIKFLTHSPLFQFEISSLITLSIPIIGKIVFSITNLLLYSLITFCIIVILHILANNCNRLIPSRWSVAIEGVYTSILGIVRDQVGMSQEIYFPFIYSLFWWLIIANLNGNVAYGYTVTTSGVTTIGLSIMIFFGVTILAIFKHNIKFFSFFIPGGTPLPLVPILALIELVSYLARAGSLGVRLFANTVAGHCLLNILSTFLAKLFTSGIIVGFVTLLPFAIFVSLVGLEVAVSFIQSYVFCVLTCSYLKDAIDLH